MREVNRRTRRRSSSVLFLGLVLGFGASAHAQTPVDAAPETTPPVTAEQPQGVPAEPAPAEPTPPAAPTVPEPPAEEAVPQAPLPPVRAGISGVVIDRETQEPLAGARVIIEGNGRRRTRVTDAEGRFEANLRSGTYSVRAVYPMYRSARRSSVRVDRGRRTEVDMPLRLFESDEEIVDVAIHIDRTSESSLLALRAQDTSVRDGVSRQEMTRTGDSNAGTAVRRVVGATVEDGSRLVVRGLGDRYSIVTLNGVPLPGTDPDRPGIQLDVLPTQVMASLSILKSFVPDLPGNFAGGLMVIDSISFPEEFTLTGGLTLGMNSQSTFRQTLDGPTGRLDWLGFDDGGRGLPSSVDDRQLIRGPEYTRAEIAEIYRDFPLTLEYRRSRALPNMSGNVTIGDSVELARNRRFGYLFGLSYNRSESRRVGISRNVSNYDEENPEDSIITQDMRVERGAEDVLWTGFGTASFAFSAHSNVRLVALYTQSAQDEVRFQEGAALASDNFELRNWQLQFSQRNVMFIQLVGEHRALRLPPDSTFRWSLFVDRTRRVQPDIRRIGYSREYLSNDPFVFQSRASAGDRIHTNLSQSDAGWLAQLRAPVIEGGLVSLGTEGRFTSRSYEMRNFLYNRLNGGEATAFEQDANTLFVPENYDELFDFRETSTDKDSYDASQASIAAFVMGDFELGEHFRLVGGLRLEAFRQEVTPTSAVILATPAPPTGNAVPVNRTDVNLLPALSLVYRPRETIALRAAYGMTVARPQLREIAPLAFYEFDRRRSVSGFAGLRSTTIHNADLRADWFVSENEVIAASLFYKYFIDPIERGSISPGNQDVTFRNADAGYDYGVELEGRVSFGRIHQALEMFSINANLALIQSRVTLDEAQAAVAPGQRRPMFGQSPYVANVSLRFDEPDAGVSVTVAYNVYGRRISDVGVRGGGLDGSPSSVTPDMYEEAFHSLDVVGAWELSEHVMLRLTGRNLANAQRRWKQGSIVVEQFRPGVEASVGATFTY